MGIARCVRGCAALMLFACASVHAQTGFYVGVDAAYSDYDVGSGDLRQPGPVLTAYPTFIAPRPVITPPPGGVVGEPLFFVAAPAAEDLDTRDTGFSFFAGYRFTPNLSAELAYFDLGSVSYAYPVPVYGFNPFAPPYFIREQTDIEITGLRISVLGEWPLTKRFGLFASAGYSFADAEVERSIDDSTLPSVTLGDRNSALGAGATFALSDKWKLRLRYERQFGIGGDAFADAPSNDSISLGVMFAP